MNKVWIKGLAALLSLGLLTSCHSSKKATGNATAPKEKKRKKAKTDTVVIAVPAGPSTADLALARKLNEKALFSGNFQTFSGKAKARLDNNGESNEFSANIRIRKSEAIWINVSALGGLVNVARVYITPDSVRMVNFLQKNARLLPFSEAGNLLPFPLSFADLEALLIGYAPAAAGLQPRGVQALPDRLLVFNTTATGEQTHFFSLPDTVLSGYGVSLQMKDAEPVAFSMALRGLLKDGIFPFFRERTATWQTGEKRGELQLSFDNPQWNGNISTPFSVPKGYNVE